MAEETATTTADEAMALLVYDISQGNPGAIRVCAEAVKHSGALGLCKLLFSELRGPDLWAAYKDEHGENIGGLLEALTETRRAKNAEGQAA